MAVRDMQRYRTTADLLKAWRTKYPGKPIADMGGFGSPEYSGNPPHHYQGPRDGDNPRSPAVNLWNYCKEGGHGFRHVGYADEVCRRRGIDHKGWYADSFESEVYRGVVAQLPARERGESLYLAGYETSESDCHTLDLSDTYTSKEDAASVADDLAKYAAERAREWAFKEDVKYRQECNRDAIKESLEVSRTIQEELDSLPATNRTARMVLRERLDSEIAKRRRLRAENEALENDPSSVLDY